MTRSNRKTVAAALVLALGALSIPAFSAASKYTATVSATQANTTVSFGCNAYSIRITNDGANSVYYDYLDGTATTSDVKLKSGETETINYNPAAGLRGWTQIGLICASGETASVRVHAICNF